MRVTERHDGIAHYEHRNRPENDTGEDRTSAPYVESPRRYCKNNSPNGAYAQIHNQTEQRRLHAADERRASKQVRRIPLRNLNRCRDVQYQRLGDDQIEIDRDRTNDARNDPWADKVTHH